MQPMHSARVRMPSPKHSMPSVRPLAERSLGSTTPPMSVDSARRRPVICASTVSTSMRAPPWDRSAVSSVHVGIAAQGYLFPAPTGVVDYDLRTPGNEPVGSVLVGYNSEGNLVYDENDAQFPIIRDVLSVGAGIGFSGNQNFYSASQSSEWTAGSI